MPLGADADGMGGERFATLSGLAKAVSCRINQTNRSVKYKPWFFSSDLGRSNSTSG